MRRLAAIGALLLASGVTLLALATVAGRPLVLVLVLALLALATTFAWYALSRDGGRRLAAVALTLASVAGAVGIVLYASGWQLLLRGLALALAFVLARYALGWDTRSLKTAEKAGALVPPAGKGVLLINPKSGGGKAERFRLADECRARGVEPVVLRPGDDLEGLAEEALKGGADVIGMAGGDGSQALVGTIAARHDVPLVVVPSGTRNHLALDLGLDRDDVVGSLDAFGEAIERRMDLAEVNGRVFVNNVSLGLYAAIVGSPEYRDAKVDVALKELPRLLKPGSRPFDLRFVTPDGQRHDGAHVVQVSNDPYGRTVMGVGSRPRLDRGLLGIVTLVVPDDASERRLVASLAAGRPERYEGFHAWDSTRFEVDSGSPVAAGLDGESIVLDPPLLFSSRPRALRVRLPLTAIGYSPAARTPRFSHLFSGLWRTAFGSKE